MAALDAFDELLEGGLKPLTQTSSSLGGDLKALGEHLEKAFRAQREFVEVTTRFAKPDDKVFADLLKPTSDAIQAITKFIETTLKRSNPRTEFVNHLQAISNSIAALGWVTVAPAPTQFVIESGVNAAQFYLNKILKDTKDDSQKAWCRQLTKLWQDLADYVKAHHRTGVTWNARGEKLTDARAAHSAGHGHHGPAPVPPPKPNTHGPAPPPPPPPGALPPPPPPVAAGNAGAEAAKAQLFAQIAVGDNVTSGLRKVEDKDRVCKNPALRGTGPLPELKKATVAVKQSGPGCGSGPAVFELRNDKEWRFENQLGKDLSLDPERAQRNHTVYIFRCENSIIRVPAKVNVIQIDSCRKVKLFVDEVIAATDVVNSVNIEVHVLVKGRLVNIDKTDGVQVFLLAKEKTAEAQSALEEIEIITSKTSTVNICTPDTKPDAMDGDYVESPVSEQFRTTKKKIEKTDKSGVKKEVYVWKTEPFESVG